MRPGPGHGRRWFNVAVAERDTVAVASTARAAVYDVTCHAPRSPASHEEHVVSPQIVVPRRGVFGISLSGERFLVEPATAVVLRTGHEYAADHPVAGGDRCTVVALDDALLDAALGERPSVHSRIGPRTELWLRVLAHGSRLEPLSLEEVTTWFLDALAGDVDPDRGELRLGPPQRDRVAEVCALMASDPSRRWSLDEVARAVNVSPYHLARQFKAVTGTTIARHLTRLRLSSALERLAEGETSLARVAADTGFAHHSHLTSRFRAFFGVPPSAIRRGFRARRLADLRHLVRTARS